MATRGIRNNNWGNIRHGNNWRGEIKGLDGGFESFSNPVWGLRALIKVTRSYERRYGINNVAEWVDRWAPVEDNNPHNAAYRKHLINNAGTLINANDIDYMRSFVKAVCQFENGSSEINKVWVDWYFDLAWELAKK